MNKVRTSVRYVYKPVGMDRADPPYGVKAGFLKEGDVVQVIKVAGCPPPNTMGHAHIAKQTVSGLEFAGLVMTNSLVSEAELAKQRSV